MLCDMQQSWQLSYRNLDSLTFKSLKPTLYTPLALSYYNLTFSCVAISYFSRVDKSTLTCKTSVKFIPCCVYDILFFATKSLNIFMTGYIII